MELGFKMLIKLHRYQTINMTLFGLTIGLNAYKYCCSKQHKEMKNLLVRQLVCECGYINDRDINVSLNIKKEGLRLLAI